MNKHALFIAMVLGLTLQAGCNSKRTVVGGPTAEEAAISLESSKREYEDCIENSGPGQPSCDALEALYEKDREAYENAAR